MELTENRQFQSNKLQEYPVIELILTRKTVRARFDTCDLSKVLAVSTRWHAHYSPRSKTFYASAGHSNVYLHHVISPIDAGLTVDHIDHDGLNNCRSNHRVVSQSLNNFNQRIRVGASGFRGVSLARRKFRASVTFDGKRHHLGYWPTAELASAEVERFIAARFNEGRAQ